MMASLSPAEISYIISGLSSTPPNRLDGRSLLSPRPINVSYGDAPQADGSARVVIGKGTEVIAGIRLEVGDVEPPAPAGIDRKGKGKESGKEDWRTRVEVDVTPQAYPQLSQQQLSTLSSQFTSMINDHFVPSIEPLPILPPTKYFIPNLQLTLISSSSGSVPTALFLAARAAFADLRIPRTKRIGLEGLNTALGSTTTDGLDDGRDAAMEETDLSGIKAAVRGGRKGRGGRRGRIEGDEWDLDLSGGGVLRLKGRERLPVLITLNLVPGSDALFIDATPQEEAACPDRIHMCFTPDKLCGLRLEGDSGIKVARIKPLLLEGQRIAKELIQGLNEEMEAEQ